MKIHTTNYVNTLIKPADDCPVAQSQIPPSTDKESIARLQFNMLAHSPYRFTSDDVLFEIYMRRNDIANSERESANEVFFSKGQACFRASPLTKRYGWAIHFDAHSKMALVETQSVKYQELQFQKNLTIVKSMRSKRDVNKN